MARPIKETPILFGEDARRFEERMHENRKISDNDRKRMHDNYCVFMKMIERGKNMKLKTAPPMTKEDAIKILCR